MMDRQSDGGGCRIGLPPQMRSVQAATSGGHCERGIRKAAWPTRLVYVIVLLSGGCQGRDDSLKWTEDVRLPDGRIVTLTRYQEFKGPHELGETPSASDYWFEFKHPDTGETVRWESDRDLATLVLMVEHGVPYLLTKPHFGTSMLRYSCPNPPYLLYRFDRDDSWRPMPLTDIPVKKVRVNMTFSPNDAMERIKASNFRLSADTTSNSMHNYRPYVINFLLMTEQTFAPVNCDRNRNYLIDQQGS